MQAGPPLNLARSSSPAPLGMGGGDESTVDVGQEKGPGRCSATDLPGASGKALTPLGLSLQNEGGASALASFCFLRLEEGLS